MGNYYFDEASDAFVIEEYNKVKPFSSFLPGIAGKLGIPLWTFYVNRGQCISSFGIGDKNNAIMEFFPANTAYKMTPINGFRTFYKIRSGEQTIQSSNVFEPFGVHDDYVSQTLRIQPHSVHIEEKSPHHLLFCVDYFTLPNSPFAGLVRKLTIKNTATIPQEIEILDGLAQVLPFSIDHHTVKNMLYTVKSWITVQNLEQKVAFFKLSMNTSDTPEVAQIVNGNFSLAFRSKIEEEGKVIKEEILDPIIDPSIIFGQNTTFSTASNFKLHTIDELYHQKQIKEGKIPCCFYGNKLYLEPNESCQFYMIIGQTANIAWINDLKTEIATQNFITKKQQESINIIESIMNDITTHSKNKLFDLYCKQTYLDNILRGGYPLVFNTETNPKVVHTFIRKHGDQERDYNWFYLEPEYFSQGNGNYRDVNQNRRCDVFFHPKVKSFNIKTFMNLIQADGFNPLVIQGTSFYIPEEAVDQVLPIVSDIPNIKEILTSSFTLGKIANVLIKNHIVSPENLDSLLETILTNAIQITNVVHGEGYWIDHWTYNLDLIENYLGIYPENLEELLFNDKTYTFFDNYVFVKTRDRKYVLVDGKVRQYGHLLQSQKKRDLIESREKSKNIVRIKEGQGSIYFTTLFVKLVTLILNKFATLDPLGMGVEMESEKPGWYDALNGLPGIFGSSMPETYELQRYCQFLLEVANQMKQEKQEEQEEIEISFPIEIATFLIQVSDRVNDYFKSDSTNKEFEYWDSVANLREKYRTSVRFGFSGKEHSISLQKIGFFFSQFLRKVKHGIERAIQMNDGLYPTYFYFEATDYVVLRNSDQNILKNEHNQPFVRVKAFKCHKMPLFLEGFVRALKIQTNPDHSRKIWESVRLSSLYDSKLKMYRLNAPLIHAPFEIGRAKGFTSGWLENGSIWMHMEYKFLLGLMNNRLYKEFYEDLRNILIPFQEPSQYGRPTTENSSFICSSSYPDEKLHGNGFYARLSGSTAEFLHIWIMMMVGDRPFFLNQKNQLMLQFKPKLAKWLFTDNNILEFYFLKKCRVIYHNPNRKNTFEDCSINRYALVISDNKRIEIQGELIPEPYSHQIRDGIIPQIEVYLD